MDEKENVGKIQKEKAMETLKNSSINKVKNMFHTQNVIIKANVDKFQLEKREK